MAPALPSLPARTPGAAPRAAANPRPMDAGILVLHPRDLDDGRRAIAAVRRGQSVVLDASGLDPALGQRLVDFTCGGVTAMDGQSRRLGEAVFLFTAAMSRIEEADAATL
ncbi:MAG: cell division protein SepF [Synechococcaceae cyanobacterium]|nr:cell division protein SepF [Synechococcaceae cyanobacterium]